MFQYIKNIKIDLIVFVLLFLIFSLIAVFFPQFPCYDFLNYHWYNTIAFLDGLHEVDFFAANIRSYFNPLIDLPSTILILKFNNHPLFLNILFTLDETVLMFFLYKIIDYLLQDRKKVVILCVSFFSIFYAFSSPVILQQSAFGQNDIVFSVYVLGGFYFFLKYILNSNIRMLFKSFILGTIIGFSFGLKLVAVSYVLLFALFFMIFRKHFEKPYQMLFLYIFGTISAFLLAHGYWCYFCYQKFGNPFFPFFNHIFHSPYADSVDIFKIDFYHMRAKSVFDFIFYCFFQNAQNYYGTDNGAWDIRIIVNYILICFIFICCCISKVFSKINSLIRVDRNILAVLLFSLIPFIINTILFGTFRYVLASFLFFGFILFFVLDSIFSSSQYKNVKIVISSFFVLLIVFIFSKYGGMEFVDSSLLSKYKSTLFYEISRIPFKKNSSVLLLNQPTSFSVSHREKDSNIKVYSYYLPDEYLEKLKDIVPSYQNRHLFSSHMKENTERLILGDDNLYVICHYLYDDIYFESLEYYNSKRDVKRILSNCKMLSYNFLGSVGPIMHLNLCEYN